MDFSKFSFGIAAIVFGDHVPADRAQREAADVRRFSPWIYQASKEAVHAKCAAIDATLISSLSGPNMLEVARMIEARYPEVIRNMPLLDSHLAHLQRANQLAQVFMPVNMAMLVNALQEEGVR